MKVKLLKKIRKKAADKYYIKKAYKGTGNIVYKLMFRGESIEYYDDYKMDSSKDKSKMEDLMKRLIRSDIYKSINQYRDAFNKK